MGWSFYPIIHPTMYFLMGLAQECDGVEDRRIKREGQIMKVSIQFQYQPDEKRLPTRRQ